MPPQNFTHKSQEAIESAQEIATENGQQQVEPPHLFLALLQQDEGVVLSVLKKLNVNTVQLNEELQRMIDFLPKMGTALMPRVMVQVLLGRSEERRVGK